MTTILAVNGDKLPCGCPASELTVRHNGKYFSIPSCVGGWDNSRSFSCSDTEHYDKWVCKKCGADAK